MPPTHSLLTVHAHPDDETISTGGVMARYSRAGHRVICVTCTGGEHGEIVVPELDTPENHARLRTIRADELARALAQLGPIDSRHLGYIDSGMMGTPQNEEPGSFWTADVDEAAGRLVRLVRETRPQVIVGYNDFGGYGHPDHIRAAQVAKLAFARAGDGEWYPEQLAEGLTPWTPAKLYEAVMDMTRRQELLEIMQQRGVRTWLTGHEDETDEERAEREAHVARMAAAAGPKTTSVDVREVLDAKVAAIREHVTQIAEGSWFLALTPDEWRQYQPTEDFTLRVARTGLVEIPESDLFAGLPPEA
jgi:N-acetyl-1-D-myo-inositol-2-amino-2-deoxy-alpha-D-glucopyranoside deacetylase